MSRISKYEQRKAVTRMFIAATLILLIIAGGIYFLPQIIFSTTSLTSKISKTNTREVEKDKDTIPPFQPKIDQLPKATAANTIDISGFGEAESKIRLYINDDEIEQAAADSDGTFTFGDVALSQGENGIYVTSTDKSGNTGIKSEVKFVTLKTDGPELELSSEVNSEKGEVKIIGSTDSDGVVTINGRRAIVGRSGSFEKIFKLENGDNVFKIVVTDSADNTIEEEILVSYSPEEEEDIKSHHITQG